MPKRDDSSDLLNRLLADAPPDRWLAIDFDYGDLRIVAAGADESAAAERAVAAGFRKPLLIRSPISSEQPS